MEFEPKILGFMCNWCSYAAADLAGVSRFQYPSNLRIIRVMCSARVDPVMVIEGFLQGADGVLVLGCHFGDCHYSIGNYYADRKMRMTKKFLEIIGINEERLYVDWVSAAEGDRFASIVKNLTSRIKEMGTLGVKENLKSSEVKERLKAAQIALQGETIRWLVGKEKELVENKNVYQEKISQEDFDRVMVDNIKDKYIKTRILLLLKDNKLSVREIADKLNLSPRAILEQIVDLQRRGDIELSEIVGKTPKYNLMKVK